MFEAKSIYVHVCVRTQGPLCMQTVCIRVASVLPLAKPPVKVTYESA